MTQPNNSKPEIRALVIDVDGTLLNSKHELTERVEKALKAAIAKGIHVILATGKSRHATTHLVDQLGIKSPGIYLQGLAVYDENGALRHQQTISAALARQVITFAEDRGFIVVVYSGERILARMYSKVLEDGFKEYHEIMPEVIGPLQNVLGEVPINKVIAIGDARAIKALRWQLGMQIGGAGRLMQAGVPTMVEVLPPGGSKGMALRQLLKDMRIDPKYVLAIGDAENDIEMIQIAGIGVAMGQSEQSVKDAADYTVASNDADGVAEALERFVLDEPEKVEASTVTETPKVVETPTPAAPDEKPESQP